MQTLAIARTVTTFLGAAADPTAEAAFQQTSTARPLTGIIGLWTALNDSGPTLKIDGATWSGTTTRAHLDDAARKLFGAPSESFATNGSAATAFPLAVADGAGDFASGTIRVRFKLFGGATDQTAGIVIGLGRSGEYYFVRYNTKDGNVAVWEYKNGARTVIEHGAEHAQLPLNAWHELTVTVAGAKVSGAVTGTPLRVEHTFSAPVTGRVGVWTKRDSITGFRDFRVAR